MKTKPHSSARNLALWFGVALVTGAAVQTALAQGNGLLVSATAQSPIQPGQSLAITVVVSNTSFYPWEPGYDLEFSWVTELSAPSWCPTCQAFGVGSTDNVDTDANASMVVTLDPSALPQAPGDYSLRVVTAYNYWDLTYSVMDGGPKTVTFTVSSGQTNHPPAIAPIGDKAVVETNLLSFTVSVTDTDAPPQTLTFALEPGAPAGAGINPTNGVFAWVPPAGDGPTTNQITIRVTDDGSPPLSSTSTFTVVVLEPPRFEPVMAPVSGVITLAWGAFPGKTYRVYFRENLSSEIWTLLGGDITATGPIAWTTDSLGAARQRFYQVVLVD